MRTCFFAFANGTRTASGIAIGASSRITERAQQLALFPDDVQSLPTLDYPGNTNDATTLLGFLDRLNLRLPNQPPPRIYDKGAPPM